MSQPLPSRGSKMRSAGCGVFNDSLLDVGVSWGWDLRSMVGWCVIGAESEVRRQKPEEEIGRAFLCGSAAGKRVRYRVMGAGCVVWRLQTSGSRPGTPLPMMHRLPRPRAWPRPERGWVCVPGDFRPIMHGAAAYKKVLPLPFSDLRPQTADPAANDALSVMRIHEPPPIRSEYRHRDLDNVVPEISPLFPVLSFTV